MTGQHHDDEEHPLGEALGQLGAGQCVSAIKQLAQAAREAAADLAARAERRLRTDDNQEPR